MPKNFHFFGDKAVTPPPPPFEIPKATVHYQRMGKFYYEARNRKGELVRASITAENEWLARKTLAKRQLLPLKVGRFMPSVMWSELNSSVESLSSNVTLEEKIILMNQIEMGISVGIPILQMMHFLQADLRNRRLRDALVQITADITEGGTLHEAFAKHPDIFDSASVGLIQTGEVSGKLDETLSRITKLLEQQSETKAKVKSAIFYPKIVVGTLVVVVLVVVYYVIPKIKDFLKTLGVELPPITQAVVAVSDFFIHRWWLIFGFVSAVYLAFKRLLTIQRFKIALDALMLRMPVLGRIFLYIELNNFCVLLELLISSGIPLIESLETLKGTQKNELFKSALTSMQEEINRGGSLTKGMEKNPVFPSTLRNLVAIGEETGRLPPILSRVGRYYQVQLNYLLDDLSKAIEPILLFVIFVAVLIVALAIFLPIWKMNSAIKMR
ncbi:MAG: type II secretion system F family protein [Proteobacteria bacterium]|nr:type II secretion system F family protein [Pseudomonadota bacterium]